MNAQEVRPRSIVKRFYKSVGPGVITGASDDDPAGIAIYSQAGAQAGYGLLWTALLTFPLMTVVQEMCARIGIVTGKGLIGAMKKHYPPVLMLVIASSVLIANTVNIGADLMAMASATTLIIPVNIQTMALIYGLLIAGTLIFFSYRNLAQIFKWLTLSLFAYIFATFVSNPSWREILLYTVLPRMDFNRETFLLITAILGTTISPYLFFWQASEEAEEMADKGKLDSRRSIQIVSKGMLKKMEHDVEFGMFFSNMVMYFIIATAASTLFRAGINNIQTAEQAALALRPLAGDASFLLFTLGIVGTGLLAIPILAGSAAYVISEIFGVHEGFNTKFGKSKFFYLVILASIVIGLSFTLFNISPFRALFLTGVLYGVISPILILVILDISNRKEIMGVNVNGRLSNILGVATFVLISLAAIGALIL